MLILLPVILVSFLILLYLFIRLGFEIYVLSQGPFYAGSSEERIKNILSLVKIKSGDKVVDLGSGDARVLISFAKMGAACTGYEIDPLLAFRSKKNIVREKLDKKIRIIPKSFWNADISMYDVIVIYGISHIMERLEKKLQNEAKKNARIISVYFQFPHMKPIKKTGDVHLYLNT